MAPRSPASSSCSVAAVGLSECATDTLRRIGLRRSVVPQCYRACRFTPCPYCCWFRWADKKRGRKTSGCSVWDTSVNGETHSRRFFRREIRTASLTFPSWRTVGATFWTNCPSVITLNRVVLARLSASSHAKKPSFFVLLRSLRRSVRWKTLWTIYCEVSQDFLGIKICVISRWS